MYSSRWLVVAGAALMLQACNPFDSGKPEAAVTTPVEQPQTQVVVAAALIPMVPVIPGGPPMPSRKPTAASGTTAVTVDLKAADAPAVARPAVYISKLNVDADLVAPTVCRKPAELVADHVRRLQTEVMIAGLRCQKFTPGIAQKYNKFVRTFSKEMVTQTKTLQTVFRRQYGGGFMKQFDMYVTALANQVSAKSQKTYGYCKSVDALLDAVNAVKPKDLGTFSTTAPVLVRTRHDKACPGGA